MGKKTKEQRLEEIITIKEKLQSLGLTSEHESITQFYTYLADFEKGFSSSGSIKLHGLNRRLEYILSCQCHIISSINLKYDKYI